MRSEDTRIWFYGFVVGTVLMLMPAPKFFFWKDVVEHVETILQYIGFVFFAICGFIILAQVVRRFIGK